MVKEYVNPQIRVKKIIPEAIMLGMSETPADGSEVLSKSIDGYQEDENSDQSFGSVWED